MRATPEDIATLAQNIVLVATYWMSLNSLAIRARRRTTRRWRARLPTSFRSLLLIWSRARRELFDHLAKRYIA